LKRPHRRLPMSFIEYILTCIDNIIPSLRDDSTKKWERMTKEGKALREEIEKQSEKAKEPHDSADS